MNKGIKIYLEIHGNILNAGEAFAVSTKEFLDNSRRVIPSKVFGVNPMSDSAVPFKVTGLMTSPVTLEYTGNYQLYDNKNNFLIFGLFQFYCFTFLIIAIRGD